MNYEQRYKKAIEKIRKGLQPLSDGAKISGVTRAFLEEVFPELGESEDEKVRKELIQLISCMHDKDPRKKDWLVWLEKQGQEPKKVSIWKHWKNGIAGNGDGKPIYLIKTGYTYSLSSCLSFECDYIELSELDNLLLEKQVEKKTIDKVEPKFKVGDWIVSKYMHLVMQILNNDNGYYKTIETDGTERNDSYDFIERNFKLWTIQDAKDGDVLVDDLDNIFIYQGSSLNSMCHSYSYCYGNHKYFVDWGGSHVIVDACPANKEQRNILFQKMKEEGYEWNPDKKELKKIEDEIEIPFGAKDSELQEVTYYIPKGFHAEIDDDKVVIKKGEKPTEWSENDEEILKNLIDYFSLDDGLRLPTEETIDWLKSLKQRIDG